MLFNLGKIHVESDSAGWNRQKSDSNQMCKNMFHAYETFSQGTHHLTALSAQHDTTVFQVCLFNSFRQIGKISFRKVGLECKAYIWILRSLAERRKMKGVRCKLWKWNTNPTLNIFEVTLASFHQIEKKLLTGKKELSTFERFFW